MEGNGKKKHSMENHVHKRQERGGGNGGTWRGYVFDKLKYWNPKANTINLASTVTKEGSGTEGKA